MKDLNFFLKILKGDESLDPATPRQILSQPDIKKTPQIIPMQTFNQSQQEDSIDSRLEQVLNHSKAQAIADEENFGIHQDAALVNSIKAELEKAGLLIVPEDRQSQVLQLDKLAHILQLSFQDKLAAATEVSFNNERRRSLAVINQLQQASDIDSLFKTTVLEVRQHLQVDRAIIYRFQDDNKGIVLAESMAAGYTPSLDETLAAQMFGAEDKLAYQEQILALNIYQGNLSPYQTQLLERFQVKASLKTF